MVGPDLRVSELSRNGYQRQRGSLRRHSASKKKASSHKHPGTQKSTNEGGGDPHRRQHTGVRREGKYRHYGGGWGGAIAWPTAHAIEETPQQARTQLGGNYDVPEMSAKVQSWCVFAGAARDRERRERGAELRGTVLLRRATGSTAEGSRHQLLQQVMVLLTSKKERVIDNPVWCATVAGKAHVEPESHVDGRQPASTRAMGTTSGAWYGHKHEPQHARSKP